MLDYRIKKLQKTIEGAKSMKERVTVNDVKIFYDKETDEITFHDQRSGKTLTLKMGEDQLDLLYNMTPYYNYKKFLLMEQDFRCADCGKNLEGLPANKYRLHHDPPKGRKGARYIDFKHLTRNRVLCKGCHEEIRRN